MRRTSLSRTFAVLSAAGVALAATAAFASPVAASQMPATGCLSNCVASFDTAGGGQFTVPTGVSELTVTVSGAAGAPASVAITNDPSGVGGPGGVTVVELGASRAGETFTFGVGSVGQGSWVGKADGSALAIAGGGGGGGYAAYLDLPEQILAVYPGGVGGAPSGPGVAVGESGVAFGAHAANGAGASATAGAGGVGVAVGVAGGTPSGVPLATGGAGGVLSVLGTAHTAGSGGGGFAGGGGGAVYRGIDGGDGIMIDLVAPGGGGSGYLDPSLSATAGTPNASGGSVAFTWSFAPAVTTNAGAEVHHGETLTQRVTGLPAHRAFSVVFDGAVVATGVADAAGAATVSFALPANQRAGSFAVQIVVDGTVAATTAAITVVAPVVAPVVPPASGGTGTSTNASTGAAHALAATGVESVWLVTFAAALLGLGAVLVRLRRSETARG